MTNPTPATVRMAGVNVPTTLAPRLLAAIRGLYPDLTAGKTDGDALAAWAKWVLTTTLAQWEGRQARAAGEDQLEKVRQQYEDAAKAAAAKAQVDAQGIT